MQEPEPKSAFWETFIRATEAESREVPDNAIAGASGFVHPVVAVGVDDARRRVVLISGEGDARSAALAQGDIQAAMPDVRVVMARPAPVNLGAAARIISELIGTVKIGPEEINWLNKSSKEGETNEIINEFVKGLPDKLRSVTFGPFASVTLNAIAAWKEIVQQLALVEIKLPVDAESPPDESAPGNSIATFDFQRLAAFDPASLDRSLGVGSIPLYSFAESDYQVFHRGTDIDSAKDILKQHDLFQYFFPPADQIALGLVDNENLTATQMLERVVQTPRIGHPHGSLELVDPTTNLNDIIDAIQQKGLVVEGELGFEMTAEGTSIRSSVKFKPREAFLAKLSRIFSVKADISLKDLFGPGP